MNGIGTISWTEAHCATGDARLLHLFFSEDPAEIAEAKTICSGCPLRLPCLEGALRRSEPWGVWGGQLFDRGEIIAQRRKRGRPTKQEVLERDEARRRHDALIATMRHDDEDAVRQVEVA